MAAPKGNPTGRPTTYTDAIADQICELLSDGDSLRKICLDDSMPARSTVFRWLSLNPSFSDQYARAKEAQAELMADEIVGISDGDLVNEDGSKCGDVQRDRLRVDARKWVAAKLLPKKYGDKVLNEHSGPDGKPIETTQTLDLSKLTDDELAAYKLLAAASCRNTEGS